LGTHIEETVQGLKITEPTVGKKPSLYQRPKKDQPTTDDDDETSRQRVLDIIITGEVSRPKNHLQ
jgi:hypothetical protein